MSEPLRLINDPQYADELRLALRQAAQDSPSGFDLEAAVQRFHQQTHAPGGSHPTASGPASGLPIKAWVAVAGVGVIGAALLSGLAVRASRPQAPPGTNLPAASALGDAAAAPSETASVAQPVRGADVDIDQEGAQVEAGAPAASVSGSAVARVDSKESRDDLYRREVLHLAEVRAALATSPGEALRMADKGHQQFARGMLYQERESLAIRASVRLGRSAEARSRAEQFVARFPRSPYVEQLRRETGLAR